MSAIHRCSSHLHEALRHDKCLFGNSPAGTSRLPGRYILHILKSNIHHLPQSSMDSNSLISNNTPPPDDHEALIQAVVKAVHTGTSFRAAGKQFGVPPTTISNRLHGRKPVSVTHEGQQLLDNAQKAAVIDW